MRECTSLVFFNSIPYDNNQYQLLANTMRI